VKKFRLARLDLEPKARVTVSKRLRLVHVSIRRLHPGRHRVDVQGNGVVAKAGAFELVI
jgi:hypothetical protein